MADPNDDDENKFLTAKEANAQIEAKFSELYPSIDADVERGDIGGLESILTELDRFKRGVQFPELYEILGARPPKGFMLVGPPGVGKTYIARYLAKHVGARFVDLPLSAFESKWVGEAEKKLQQHLKNFKIYNVATGKDVLVFFDEAEEIFRRRDSQGWHGPRVNVLLREMDGLGDTKGILFGAATNHVETVDPAILRPGRLDFIINIPQYDAKMLGDVFRAQRDYRNRKSLKSWSPYRLSLEECVELGKVAASRKMTPADIAEVYRRAAEERVRVFVEEYDDKGVPREATFVSMSDIEKVVSAYEGKKEKRRIGFNVDR